MQKGKLKFINRFKAHLVVLLNLIILAATRWVAHLATRVASLKSRFNVKHKVEAETAPTNTLGNDRLLSESSTAAAYNIFALIECHCHFDPSTDLEASFKILLAKNLPALNYISVKLLSAGNLAVTIKHIPIIKLELYIECLNFCALTICKKHQKHLTAKNVKIGLCNYRASANQTLVYQQAKSALTLSQQSPLQHCHRLGISHSRVNIFSNNQIIKSIKKNKFVIYFQPLFELDSGRILQHEVLIRVRGGANELLLANAGINQLDNDQDAFLFDQAIIIKVKKLLLADTSAAIISISLHPKNWFNKAFWQWLITQVSDFKIEHKLQFEINAADFFKYQIRLQGVLKIITKLNYQIIIDGIKSSDHIVQLVNYPQVLGVKLAYDLVHSIEASAHQQSCVKNIVNACQLLNIAVFASDVETKQELQMLTILGVDAAQGFYFTQLLPDFTQTVFH